MTINQGFHGSDIEKIGESYGVVKEELINFSANVNPLGISPYLQKYLPDKIQLIATYPDREYTSLRGSISEYIGVPEGSIVVGNGSTELISLCIQTVHPKKAMIIGPTYSEYERELKLIGCSCFYYPLREENGFWLDPEELQLKLATTPGIELLVLCNPNNPTSSFIPKADLRLILDTCRDNNIFVMIDETYIEFVDSNDNPSSVVLSSEYANFFTIRGVSKFFAAPGLRLGYGISGNPEFLNRLNNQKNPWTVNSLSAYAGELMLKDSDYIKRTRSLIFGERDKMLEAFSEYSYTMPFPAYANFILVRLLSTADNPLSTHKLFEAMLQKKLVIREATSFPFLKGEFFRVCTMLPEQNDLLLKSIFEEIEFQLNGS